MVDPSDGHIIWLIIQKRPWYSGSGFFLNVDVNYTGIAECNLIWSTIQISFKMTIPPPWSNFLQHNICRFHNSTSISFTKRKETNTTLLFSLKGHEERRGQVNTMLMEHFNNILFHKSGLANKQLTYHLIIYKASCILPYRLHSIIVLPTNWKFSSRGKKTSEHHSDGTLQRHSLPHVRTC